MITHPIRLLLVEDNEDDVGLLSEYLDMLDGYKVELVHVPRVRDATRLLAESHFDVLLLDLSLPDSQGLDTVSRVRAQDVRIPIIIMTGLNDQALAYEAARFGAQDYLVKGKVDSDVLGRSIRYAIERARTEHELRRHRDHLGELVTQRTADLRVKSEQLVEEIEQRHEAVETRILMATAIEHAAEAFLITTSEGLIEYVNPAFERMTGYTREDAVGRNASLLKSGEHSDAFYAEFYSTISSGKIWHGQFINRRKDGTRYTCETNVSSVRDSAGRVTKYIEVMRDVTEEIKLREQLNRTQRIESVGQLAGGLAHDFNNVLQAVLGYSQLGLAEIDSSHPLHHNFMEICNAANRAADLTRQLLAFSRKQILEREAVCLTDVINSLTNMLGRLLGDDIELEYLGGHNLGTVEADSGQMEQVLVNLCVNARDAMPMGGRITIETENVLLNGNYTNIHPWARPGRYVLLTVSDTGTGMSPEVMEKIFEPFYTTKPEGKGTGLGLAMVYGIVKQHDGFIHVYSEEGKGTTFKIYLPLSSRKAMAVGTKVEGATRGGAEAILVVEDDPAIRALVEKILAKNGYTVKATSNGLEALQVIEAGERFDLIISDVVMPKLGGLELYARLEAYPDRPPILLTSGYTSRAIDPDITVQNNVGLLQKPYGPDELLKKMRALLDGR